MNRTLREAETRRKGRTRLILAGLFGLLAGAILAARPAHSLAQQSPAADTTYSLQRIYKAGDTDRYQMAANLAVDGPQSMKGSMLVVYKETIKSVKPDGTAVVVNTFEKGMATRDEQKQDLTSELTGGTVTSTRDKLGRVSDTKAEGFKGRLAENNIGGQQMFTRVLPALYSPKPVKAGDTWKVDIDLDNEMFPGMRAVGNSTLVGSEKVGDIQTLKVKTLADATKEAIKLHLEAITNLDAETGKIVRLTVTSNGDLGPFGKLKVDNQLALLGSDGKPVGDAGKKADAEKKADTDKPTQKP